MTVRLFVLALSTACAALSFEDGPTPTADSIMRRVAENQDREQKARTGFVFEEKVHRAMRTKSGKLLHEEYRTFTVTPGAKGVGKKLDSVRGRYWKKGKYFAYEGEPVPEGGIFEICFDDDEEAAKTKDGIDQDLFPLTSEAQRKYSFQLVGERLIRERRAYRIQFRPTDRTDYAWTGEALIDQQEFQPVSVYTRLSRRLPLAVRTMLGIDVPGLGFSVEYARVDKDLWFPAAYGYEFGVRALFLFNRTFSESTENSNFRRTAAESRITYDSPAAQ